MKHIVFILDTTMDDTDLINLKIQVELFSRCQQNFNIRFTQNPWQSQTWKKLKMNLVDMLELLKLHTIACYSPTTSAKTPTHQVQAERNKRPILSLSGKMMDPEDYNHFVYTFQQCKNRLGDDQDGATLLREWHLTMPLQHN